MRVLIAVVAYLATGLVPATAAALDAPVPCPGCKKFRPMTSPWQWQLQGKIDTSVKAKVYDVDGADVDASVVQKLHAKGRKVICYFNAGAHEPFRPDSAGFPPETRGRVLEGFEDERWLDVRQIDKLAPVIRGRLDTCKAKGFDAVEPDNVDAYQNRSGFPLKAADQLRYNVFLANEAHRRGLAVGLKNDTGQVKRLVPYFDFAVVEQCFEFDECEAYAPFVDKNKAVFVAEYETRPSEFCDEAKELRFSAIFKRLSLKAFRKAC